MSIQRILWVRKLKCCDFPAMSIVLYQGMAAALAQKVQNFNEGDKLCVLTCDKMLKWRWKSVTQFAFQWKSLSGIYSFKFHIVLTSEICEMIKSLGADSSSDVIRMDLSLLACCVIL